MSRAEREALVTHLVKHQGKFHRGYVVGHPEFWRFVCEYPEPHNANVEWIGSGALEVQFKEMCVVCFKIPEPTGSLRWDSNEVF